MDLPRNDPSVLQQIKKSLDRLANNKFLESIEPDVHPSLNGQVLSNTRNDHDPSNITGYVFEFRALSQKEDLFSFKSFPYLRILDPTLAKHNDVFGFMTRSPQPMIELQRKVLIQQNLQEACFTAGGICSATCAAYRRAARICSWVIE